MAKTVTIRLSYEDYKKISLSAQFEHRPISNFITNTVLKEIEESDYVDTIEMAQIKGDKKLTVKLKSGHNDAKKMRGRLGKFYLFAGAIKTNYVWLAVIGILNSVISLYYYFKIVYFMFFKDSAQPKKIKLSPITTSVLLITTLFTIIIGILPQQFIGIVKNMVFMLHL